MEPTIDPGYFGPYLTGFVDGEGCFMLYMSHANRRIPTPHVAFVLHLRSDDIGILDTIRDYWKCGRVYKMARPTRKNPEAVFKVTAGVDLVNTIIPHFEKYPLLAKKQKDFVLWKQGVQLFRQVQLRPKVCRGVGCGSFTKWTDEERTQFAELVTAMKARHVCG